MPIIIISHNDASLVLKFLQTIKLFHGFKGFNHFPNCK